MFFQKDRGVLFQRNDVQEPIKYQSTGQPRATRPGSPGDAHRAIRPLRGLHRPSQTESRSGSTCGGSHGVISYRGA